MENEIWGILLSRQQAGGKWSLVSVHRGQKYPEPAAGCRDDDAVILGGEEEEGKKRRREKRAVQMYDKLISATEEKEERERKEGVSMCSLLFQAGEKREGKERGNHTEKAASVLYNFF